MGNLSNYARRELDRIESDGDGMQTMINNHVMDMITLFEDFSHSGLTANYTIGILERLLRYLPLEPLTGEDSEWDKIGNGKYQNNRCFHVFKDEDGKPYDSEARIISSDGGLSWFTNHLSKKYITFPYVPPTVPERVYIEYFGDTEDYEIITNNPERIAVLRKRMMSKDDAPEA